VSEGMALRSTLLVRLTLIFVVVAILGMAVMGLYLARALTEMGEVTRSLPQAMLVGALLALGVALAVGAFIRRRVTRPVTEMQAVAQRWAQGDFSQRTPVTGVDEIAALGRTLNRMAGRLREKIADLEGERAKAAAILDSMVEGVIAIDQRGRILLMNPAAHSIFSLRREPVEGRPFLEVVRHKELLDFVEACQGTGAGAHGRQEVQLGPPIARTLDVHASAIAFTAAQSGTLLVLHDMTELRRLEQVRTEFVANVSHELRTPLTSIRGYLETLLDGALEDPTHARRFLQVVSSHTERLSRLVDDLLQLSDLETGKVILKLAPILLREVSEDVAAIFETQAAQKALTLRHQVPPALRVRADRDRLTQILVNLVDNAVKYTPEGGQVSISATSRGAVVEVSVQDTGSGIPSTDLPRISERFYRVDRARSRQLGGTGLGLAIVKHLVQAHGGELRIESELGRGTTVRFTLPAA